MARADRGATVRALAREGASVAVVDVDVEGGTQVVEDIRASGGSALWVQADLAEESEVAGAIRTTVDQFGRLDVLHNNAALTESEFLSRDTPVTELSLEVWERTIAVNLSSQMLMCKHAIPQMVRGGGGSIINMSSGASLKGDRTRTAYGVSKAGVNTLTMYVAAGHGKQGVRANTIVPGLIITDAVRGPHPRRHARSARPVNPHPIPGPTRRYRQSRRLPGVRRVSLHHRSDGGHRRRYVCARRHHRQ